MRVIPVLNHLLLVLSLTACAAATPPPPQPIPTQAWQGLVATSSPATVEGPTATPTPLGYAETAIAGTVAALTPRSPTPLPATATPTPSLTPTLTLTPTLGPTSTPSHTPVPTLLNVMRADPNLTTTAGFLERAGLAEQLNGSEDLTVLAPTNDAWAALDDETIALLLSDDQALTDTLRFHVVAGRISAEGLQSPPEDLLTLLGVELRFPEQGITLRQTLTTPTNGLIHVLEGVMVPPPADPDVLPTP